jgi:hypothetical protein
MLSFPFTLGTYSSHHGTCTIRRRRRRSMRAIVLSHSQAVMADNNKQWATSFGKRKAGRRLGRQMPHVG